MRADLKDRPQSRKMRLGSARSSHQENRTHAEEFFKKGKTHQLNKQHEKAIESYMRAIVFDQKYFQAFCNMGSCYKAIGKYAQARSCYRNALLANPNDHITHYNLANLHRVTGQNELALEHYQAVLMKSEKGEDVGALKLNSMVNMGICYKNLGAIDKAISMYQKVYELDSKEEAGVFNLAICLIDSMQDNNSQSFGKVCQERAKLAESLLNDVLSRNANSFMAQLYLIKMSYLLDSSEGSIRQSIDRLKVLLQAQDCDITLDIKQAIGYCHHKLKQYEQSAKYYSDSTNKLARRPSALVGNANEQINILSNFAPERKKSEQVAPLTELQGIELIERGEYLVLENRLDIVSDMMLKNTLKLIMYLRMTEQDPTYKQTLVDHYDKNFQSEGKPIPFDKISNAGHKAIGKVLTMQGLYQQSIEHYQHISRNIDKSPNKAKAHSSLGQGYAEAGNLQKALEEYQTAFEIEPENYSLAHDIGYCYYQRGDYSEATSYFQKFLAKIKADYSLTSSQKQLYTADCLINLALANQDPAYQREYYQDAFKAYRSLKQGNNDVEMQEDSSLTFFVRLAEIYEEDLKEVEVYLGQDYCRLREKLKAVYQALLQFSGCPDREQLLINCGNFHYEVGEYLLAIGQYTQVEAADMIPYSNLALCYLHLVQPWLTSNYIQMACKQSADPLTLFNRDIIDWIYSSDRGGRWNSLLPNLKQDLFYERQEYGTLLIDQATLVLNQETNLPSEQLPKRLENIIKGEGGVKFREEWMNHKFEKLTQLMNSYGRAPQPSLKNNLNEKILRMAFHKAGDLKQTFKDLCAELLNLPSSGKQEVLSEAIIYMFIYYNQYDSYLMEMLMSNTVAHTRQNFSLNLPNPPPKELTSVLPDYRNARHLTTLLNEWQNILQPYIAPILKIIQQQYYQCQVRKPLQIEYHFPRHSNFVDCQQTFQKMLYIILKIIKFQQKMTCKGNKLKDMKTSLIKQFETSFNEQIQFLTRKPLTLSEDFLSLTIYATFHSKEICQDFINTLAKMGTDNQKVIVGEEEEVTVLVSGVVRLRCRWSDPFTPAHMLKQVMENMVENPLYIVNQAILALDQLKNVLAEDSPLAAQLIKEDSTLNY